MKEEKKIAISVAKYAGIASLTFLTFILLINYPKYLEVFSYSMARFLVMGLSFILLYFFQKKIRAEFMKSTIILLFLVGLIYYPLYGRKIDGADLLVLPIAGILLSVLPLSLYSPVTHRRHIAFWNSFLILSCLVVTMTSIPSLPQAELKMFQSLIAREPMIPFAFVGSFLSLNWIIYQYQLADTKTRNETEVINNKINDRIEASAAKSLQLKSENKELEKLQNDLLQAKSTLESKVASETKNLNAKSKVLLKYSYINSHILRAPIVRIKSVLGVWNELPERDRSSIIRNSMEEVRSILDIIIRIDDNQIDSKKASQLLKDYYYIDQDQ